MHRLGDSQRLDALLATGLLDTPPEEEFDRFTRFAARIVGAPVALVSLVDGERQFFKSALGLGEPWATKRETPLSHSFCKHVVADASPLVIGDAREHPELRDNLAIRDLGVIAYLGMPLVTMEGRALGSFCAIDTTPRQWTPEDISAMRELAEMVMERIELRLAAKRLQEDYIALRTLEMHRDELVHMLVHDLRNPLTSIIMGMETLVRAPGLSDKDRAFGGVATRGGLKLLEMINTILDVSKAEAGRMTLDLADASVPALVATACEQLESMAAARTVSLKAEVAPGLAPLRADAEKLRRVLVNLIANAIQHSRGGGQVSVRAEPDPGCGGVRFVITDAGYGIAPEAFDRIFEKFGQTGGRKIKGVVSTGLGLPFARMVVETHGGRISVESELGRGTAFSVALPYVPMTPGPSA